MDRTERLLSRSTRSSRILEIGPGYSPVAPKAAGWNTHVVDHADRDELRIKYRGWGVDVRRIEEVDTVWHEGPLHAVVPAEIHGGFDTLIASHLLEHIPDVVGFLASAAILCRPGAAVVLALPDQRFCFDYFQPHSTTGDVLAAHLEQRSRHSFAATFNQFAYSVRLDGNEVVGQEPVQRVRLMGDFSAAAEYFDKIAREGPEAEYRDAHGWMFTPAGFALIMLELGRLGVVDWRIDELHPTEGCEFIVILTRGVAAEDDAEAFQRRRLDLLTQRLLERKEQVDFAVAGGLLPGAPTAAPGAAQDPVLAQRLVAQEAGLAELRTQVATHVGALNGAIAVLCENDGERARQFHALAPLAATVDNMQAQTRSIAAALQQLAQGVAEQEQRAQDAARAVEGIAGSMARIDAHGDALRMADARLADVMADVARQRERVALLEQVLGRITARLAPFSRMWRMLPWRPSDGRRR